MNNSFSSNFSVDSLAASSELIKSVKIKETLLSEAVEKMLPYIESSPKTLGISHSQEKYYKWRARRFHTDKE